MSAEHRDLYAKHIAGMKKFVPTRPQDGFAHEPRSSRSSRRRSPLGGRRARYVVALLPKLQTAVGARICLRRCVIG